MPYASATALLVRNTGNDLSLGRRDGRDDSRHRILRPMDEAHIPALRFHALTRFYDPVVRFTTRETTFKPELVRRLSLAPGERALDLGCGTGTLTLMLADAYPHAYITGIDADKEALAIARRKRPGETPSLRFLQGLAQSLPFADEEFHGAVSSLFFHHLTQAQKRAALRELYRVLKPAGRVHIADWGRPTGVAMRALFYLVQALDGFATTQDSVLGVLPALLQEAGFIDVDDSTTYATPLGTMRVYRTAKPGTPYAK